MFASMVENVVRYVPIPGNIKLETLVSRLLRLTLVAYIFACGVVARRRLPSRLRRSTA